MKGAFRARLLSLYSVILVINAMAWVALWLLAQRYSILASLGILSYVFGLRHAVDADHIAAIDNATRKLVQDGKRQVATGFFFALGHASIVIVAVLTAIFLQQVFHLRLSFGNGYADIVGMGVSSLFLYVVGGVNLAGLYRSFKIHRMRSSGADIDVTNPPGGYRETPKGLFSWVLAGMFRLIRSSWHMYFVGLLFGLGFDTASEILTLGVSAYVSVSQIAPWAIAVLPALFAAGMTLVDATDGVLMLHAYHWTFRMPRGRNVYNAVVTLISVVMAFSIATIEILQVPGGALVSALRWLPDLPLTTIGYAFIAVLGLTWLTGVAVSRVGKSRPVSSDGNG